MRARWSLLFICVAAAGCTEHDPAPGAVAPVPYSAAPAQKVEGLAPTRRQTPVNPGPLKDDVIAFQFAVYLLGPAPANLEATAAKLARQHAPSVTLVKTMDPDTKGPALAFTTPAIDTYAPPSAENLEYFARGLSPDELAKTPSATGAFVVNGVSPADQADGTHRALLALTHALAVKWKGVLWDEATREVFSTAAWAERRLAWKEGPPDVRDHVTMHQCDDGELERIISLGMSKFGLPDVVANDVASGAGRSVANLGNLVMQTLVESPTIATAGKLQVDIEALTNSAAKADQAEHLLENAKKVATLDIAFTPLEEGDAPNRLLELVFAGPGESAQEGQYRVTALVYGSTEKVVKVTKDDRELEAARVRALAAFLKLKRSFARRKPGTQLQAKAPFTTDSGGVEWMWCDVTGWKGTKVQGVLANEPFEVSGLEIGAHVEFEESAVFDYILTRPDGSTEGNETGAIIDRLQGQ